MNLTHGQAEPLPSLGKAGGWDLMLSFLVTLGGAQSSLCPGVRGMSGRLARSGGSCVAPQGLGLPPLDHDPEQEFTQGAGNSPQAGLVSKQP